MSARQEGAPGTVILEGSNGDWAQKSYLPALVDHAAKGDIDLWAVDIEPRIRLADQSITSLWKVGQSNDRLHYVNKNRDREFYERFSDVDIVFIVAPDRYHSEIAEFWLRRVSQRGKIFIEKPLDASLPMARGLRRKTARCSELVIPFDHYLARAWPFLQTQKDHRTRVGKIESIEFHILESSVIPPHRVEALDKGVVIDLFCHVLALVGAVFDQNTSPSSNTLQSVRLQEVRTAQYDGCPISGETLARIRFTMGDLEVTSIVGKGIGSAEDKSMTICGSEGTININFTPGDHFIVVDPNGEHLGGGELEPRHVESFLDSVLRGESLGITPGVFNFDAALQILETMTEAKNKSREMAQYHNGDALNDIL